MKYDLTFLEPEYSPFESTLTAQDMGQPPTHKTRRAAFQSAKALFAKTFRSVLLSGQSDFLTGETPTSHDSKLALIYTNFLFDHVLRLAKKISICRFKNDATSTDEALYSDPDMCAIRVEFERTNTQETDLVDILVPALAQYYLDPIDHTGWLDLARPPSVANLGEDAQKVLLGLYTKTFDSLTKSSRGVVVPIFAFRRRVAVELLQMEEQNTLKPGSKPPIWQAAQREHREGGDYICLLWDIMGAIRCLLSAAGSARAGLKGYSPGEIERILDLCSESSDGHPTVDSLQVFGDSVHL